MRPTEYAMTTNKAGKEIWYQIGRRSLRYVRVNADAAKLAIATGAGVQVPYMPPSRGDIWLKGFEQREALRAMPCGTIQ